MKIVKIISERFKTICYQFESIISEPPLKEKRNK